MCVYTYICIAPKKKNPKKCPVSESLKGADIMGLLLLVGKEKERTATHGSSSSNI
jgi:hypothetical protein